MDIKNGNPLFTIIVAVLNSGETIRRCIESVNSQTYPYRELVIIDGGSTDGTVEILTNRQNDITYWESKPDRGIYHAWNKALKHAHGEWICFLGADDYFWNDHVLTDMVPYLINAEKAGIRVVYGQAARVDKEGRILALLGKPWEKISWQIRYGMPLHLPHPGMMHHQSLFQEHGRFDQTFKIAGDYEFLLRELKNKKKKGLYIEFQTMGCQIGGAANANQLATLKEARKARLKNGLPGFSWFWIAVYVRAVIRKFLNRHSESVPPILDSNYYNRK